MRYLIALLLALTLAASCAPTDHPYFPGVPANATIFEDGSWRTPDGTTGCMPNYICNPDGDRFIDIP